MVNRYNVWTNRDGDERTEVSMGGHWVTYDDYVKLEQRLAATLLELSDAEEENRELMLELNQANSTISIYEAMS